MSAETSREIEKAQYWLLLKQAWSIWQSGKAMPTLSAEALAYFENLSFFRFNELLQHPEFDGVPPVESPREAWAHVLRCFTAKRPIASLYLMEDIFSRASDRARELGLVRDEDRIEYYVGVLVNQFQMRIGEAVKAYARDFGTLGTRRRKVSLDAPVQSQNDSSERTRMDFESMPDEWGSETERHEVEELGPRVALAYFPGIRPVFKLSIFLRSLRLRRCVTISCDTSAVLDLAGVKKAVFADGAKKTLERDFPLHVLELPECADLDKAARYQVCLGATVALLDQTDLWLWLSAWLRDLAQERKDLPAVQFASRAQAFVELLAASLREAGDYSSENEIQTLFHRIKELS